MYMIKDLGPEDRPRERLIEGGPERLSNAELIAVLLHTGARGRSAVQLGQQLLTEFGGLEGLHSADFSGLVTVTGVGPAKAAQLQAAIELGRRLTLSSIEDRPAIQSPEQVADLLMYEMGALEQEHLRVLCLDTRNRLIRIEEVYRGSLNSSQIRIAEVFRPAVRANAAGIIVVHNHPSGDPSPSAEDVAVTRAIMRAGEMLDLELLDHLVIGRGRYVSMKSRSLGFDSV